MDGLGQPAEGFGKPVVGSYEVIDALAYLLNRGKAGGSESRTAEDAEPDFDLVEPTGMGGREVEVDIGVASEPGIVFGFVGVEVVEDNMELLIRVGGNDMVHKGQEFFSPAPLGMHASDLASPDFKSSKQGSRSMPLVLMTLTADSLAIGQSQVALRPLQSLDTGLLIHTEDNRVLRWRQIEANDFRGFGDELGVCADTPAAAALKLHTIAPQDAPDLVRRDISQLPGKQRAIPLAVAVRRRLVELGKDALLRVCSILARPAGTPLILKSGEPGPSEPNSPSTDRRQTHSFAPGDAGGALSSRSGKHHSRAKSQSLLGRRRTHPPLQLRTFIRRKDYRCGYSAHTASIS